MGGRRVIQGNSFAPGFNIKPVQSSQEEQDGWAGALSGWGTRTVRCLRVSERLAKAPTDTGTRLETTGIHPYKTKQWHKTDSNSRTCLKLFKKGNVAIACRELRKP